MNEYALLFHMPMSCYFDDTGKNIGFHFTYIRVTNKWTWESFKEDRVWQVAFNSRAFAN